MSNFPTQAQAADRDDDLFGDPISVYTDGQAIENGFLVDVTGSPASGSSDSR